MTKVSLEWDSALLDAGMGDERLALYSKADSVKSSGKCSGVDPGKGLLCWFLG